MAQYAQIVLPLAQPAYTYSIPEGMDVKLGQGVAVQFGAKGYYTGIVWQISDQRPDYDRLKPIHHIVFHEALLSSERMRLWEWLSEYYMTPLGEVMRVALPQLMKPSGRDEQAFLVDEYHPRKETYCALAEAALSDDLAERMEKLMRKAPRQYEALQEILKAGDDERNELGEVPRRLIRAEVTVLRALEKKHFIRCVERDRSVEHHESQFLLPELSLAQQTALDELRKAYAEGRRTALLQGVTGSGKTEIYIHLIAECLSRGEDVLLLVPEIALTSQLIERMKRIFGSRVIAYHSKISNVKRTEIFLDLSRKKGGEFVVGARSSLFLPLNHLKLIIVDEEHDTGYKQTDPTPRYHARDVAVMMAHLFEGRTLLGSATPSLESWLNARSGKYGWAQLNERYGSGRLPRILVSDTLRAARRGERKGHFNRLLIDKIEQTLQRHEQVMLFQNRRGFSPYLECTDCGWTARCPECNVTLTYHKVGERLVCHYCGYTIPKPQHCPACKVADLTAMGFGTEQVEEQIAELFPEARVARLDRDKATSERAYNAIISAFEHHEIDILVGTQMITKGFDFEGVSLVGILNADNLIYNPDFRASERAFQMMQQVAGRAGRRSEGGEVVIQTSEPTHPIIRQVAEGDYEQMARTQLIEREAFFYPPYARLTLLKLRHSDLGLLREAACNLAESLRQRFGRRLLGPITPPVDRIRGEYRIHLLLKIEHGASSKRAREVLREELKNTFSKKEFKRINYSIDVDPQ